MKRYWNRWQFKHPKPEDFLRVMEQVSDMELDWYLSYYKDQVKSIDYSVEEIRNDKSGAQITLNRIGLFPMPIDLLITYESGRQERHNIPLISMYGAKEEEGLQTHKPLAMDSS